MLDINKSINDPELFLRDPEGHMYDLPPWSRKIAQGLAIKEGLGELSKPQWRVLRSLRGFYRKNGHAQSARHISQALARDFAAEGGRRYLYRIFPHGPIVQGSRLAGLPVPPNSGDPSFGRLD